MNNIFILPGLGNSGEQHWQTRWEALHPSWKRILQDDWDTPVCADWVRRIDETLANIPDGTAVLIAHSSSCAAVAHLVQTTKHRIKSALLVAPSDPLDAAYPAGPTGFAPVPLLRLPFPSMVVASENDEYISLEQAQKYAEAWGSRLVNIGAKGHINSSSGLGDWEEGLALLSELL
ncbi:MAG: RBBP9/YdeN family alpha/beta hydrolase [Candidatus Kapaibacteriota bacterium]|jgi:predicted alpha/beta hydrolase family esterase